MRTLLLLLFICNFTFSQTKREEKTEKPHTPVEIKVGDHYPTEEKIVTEEFIDDDYYIIKDFPDGITLAKAYELIKVKK